jgi:type VI secretion system FHA domain protein
MPESMSAEAAPPPAAASGEDVGESQNTAGGMMLSWDERGQRGVFDGTQTVVFGGAPRDRRRGERRRSVPPSAAPTSTAAAPEKEAHAAAEQALLRALMEGLGLDRWPDDRALDTEAVRLLGKLLRSAVQGTIDLLRARALIKSEVQAQMTMIVARDNNPLKFSPNAEAALAHLLGPAQKGFMSATAAMEDAYADLVAHQFGFTAGTRAALADVLRRFDPAKLEERLAGKSVLDAVLPAHRKAKLWDLFTEHFAQISEEAEDDFQRLFGKEFLRAYEEQAAKMRSQPHKEDS